MTIISVLLNRINVDTKNENCIELLIYELKQYSFKNTSVYFGLLDAITPACSSIASNCLTSETFSLKTLQWNKLLFSAGLIKDILNIYPRTVTLPCAALQKNSFVIDSQGYFYKCWDDIGEKDKSIGRLGNLDKNELQTNNAQSKYLDWNPFTFDKCKNCDILPICSGYCAFLGQKDGEPRCSKWKYTLKEYLNDVIESKVV